MAAILSTSFAAAVTDWAAQWSLASVTGVQIGHLCAAESELAQVTKVGPGTTVTVRRGVEATAAAAHATSTPVAVYVAGDVQTGESAFSPAAAPLYHATITLTDAQIKALPTTPVVLIPAPGIGRVAMTWTTAAAGQMFLRFNARATYANVDPAACFVFFIGSAPTSDIYTRYGETNNVRDFFLSTVDMLWVIPFNKAASVNGQMYDVPGYYENNPTKFSIDNAALGALTGGTSANRLTVTVPYFIFDLATGLLV